MTESPSDLVRSLQESIAEYLRDFDYSATLRTHPRSISFVRRSTERLVAMIDAALELTGEARERSGTAGARTNTAAADFASLALEVIDLGIGLRAWARAAHSEHWIASVWVDPGSSPVQAVPVQYHGEFQAAEAELLAKVPLIADARPWLEATAASEQVEGSRPAITELAGLIKRLTLAVLDEVAPITNALGSRMTKESWARFYDDDDRPRTDAEVKAWDLWHHDLWPESGRQYRRALKRSVVTGGGPWAARVSATVGSDARQHVQVVLSSDPRTFGVKRRARTREFFRPPSVSPNYTHAFGLRDFQRIYDAVAYANRQGVVLNASVTIAWFMLEGCTPGECAVLFDRFKKNLVQWLLDKVGEPAPVVWPAYVHELAGGTKHHSHMRIAVPPELSVSFREEVSRVLRRVIAPRAWPAEQKGRTGKPSKFVLPRVHSVPAPDPERKRPVTYDQWIGVMYLLKGANPGVELRARPSGQMVHLGDIIRSSFEDPGPAWTKRRLDASQNLKQKARQTFRDVGGGPFESLLDAQLRTGEIDVRELYSDHYLDAFHGKLTSPPPTAAEDPLSSLRFW